MMKFMVRKYLIIFLMSLFSGGTVLASVAQSPLFLMTSVDPNVLFNMSVETPMGGAAYNDQPDVATGCGGRMPDPDVNVNEEDLEEVGICYFPGQTYLGYFDPDKCYIYSSDRFVPAGATNASHECSGQYSGNFMNWATMTAMDMFVYTMTGGNRVVDTTSETVIRRTRKVNNDSWFPHKLIISASSVTPWSGPVYIHNTDFGVEFGSAYGTSDLGTNNVQIKVCESSSLEANCVPYGSPTPYYKPEGLIQKNADHMRFGVTSYTNTDGNGIDGGVLRSNMKYVGTTKPDGSGGTEDNPNKEINADGTIDTNSNPADATASSVSLSGVISYLNKFSDAGYKENDPASELFYESIRYYKNLGPTAEYLTGDNGSFPILDASRWQDPIQYWCQNNFIIGINDANPWKDKRLPGTFFTSDHFPTANDEDISDDYGEPSTPDTEIDVTRLTKTVGTLEGLTGTPQCIGCTAGNCDMSTTSKTITGLGEVMGTCPNPDKENSYYIAGLAYYANTQDIRTGAGNTTNYPDKQTISSFLIDTQEYSSSPFEGRMNMLWTIVIPIMEARVQ
jgi:type IV pilus assembly protein PilY1